MKTELPDQGTSTASLPEHQGAAAEAASDNFIENALNQGFVE